MGHVMISLVQIMKRKTQMRVFPSPPSFKGRRWWSSFFRFILHTSANEARQSMQNCITEVMVSFICFYYVFRGGGAVQFCTLFFFFNFRREKSSAKLHCTAPSKCMIETNKTYHELHDEILNWLGWFMFVFGWKMKRKVHFPHLLPLKEGGEESAFLQIFHTITIMKQHN